jgi:hypothetical protein
MQYNPDPSSNPMQSYIDQAQLMGLNPARHERQTGGGLGTSDQRDDQNRSPDMETQWNGYFGSS